MTRELTKGANAFVVTGRVELVLTWSGSVDVDVAALLCSSSTGKVRSDDDFVFYNQPRHSSGSVSHIGKQRGVESTDTLGVDLSAVESGIEKIIVSGSADGGNFGQLNELKIAVIDPQTKEPLLEFRVSDASVETAMIMGELYRRDGQWKFRAVGQGYASGLAGVARDFGISIADEPQHDPPPQAPPIPLNSAAPSATRPTPQSGPGKPSRPRHPNAMPQLSPEALPPQSAAATRRPPASSADAPSLQVAAHHLSTLVPWWQRAADHVGDAANQIVYGVLSSHDDLGPALTALSRAREEVSGAFQSKFGRPAPSGYGGAPVAPEAWLDAAHSLAGRLRTDQVPWTEKRRKIWTDELNGLVSTLLGAYDPTVRELEVSTWTRMRQTGARHAEAIMQSAMRNAPAAQVPPPPIGPRSGPMDPNHPEATGPGPLNVYLGNLVADSLSFTTVSHGGHQSAMDRFALPALRIPVVVDLDGTGALVVDDRRCLEASVLNLLSALPANQLLLKIFDPEHGGDSAKFLYGLGDSADRIIGDRVKTSERELNDLLQSTEEHITFVTQRFLQGEHDSLTEYNRAAGEVAEPYQLLVLYDFPSGFSRSGHFDEDQLDRLNKIIRNGPRTGIFTVLVCQDKSLLPNPADAQSRPNGLVVPPSSGAQAEHRKQGGAAVTRVLEPLPWFLADGTVKLSTLQSLANGPAALRVPSTAEHPRVLGSLADLRDPALFWRFEPTRPPDEAVATSQLDAVKRNMNSARDVQVTPERVAQLADQAQRSSSATLGQRFAATVAFPDQPETWWRATSERGVVSHFGRIGARQVADLIFDSEVNTYSSLIGGRPGSGKSVLIHAIVMSIATEYAPSEVELYLIDFKEGVEFKQYADIGLPHARVIAIESERDFGLSVLQRAAAEIKHRGELFRGAGGVANLEQFRGRTGEPLKRLVLIIDEFQQLFYRDDKIAAESAEMLELILRQGRAFGIHLLLASQSLAGMASLGKHVLGLMPTRIALQSNEADSRMILGEENTDAQSLVRSGEGILNRKGGHKEANERFQAAYWDPDARTAVLQRVANRAVAEGHPDITTVFDGHKPVDVTTLDPTGLVPPREPGFSGVLVPVGLPLTLDPVPLFARLRREAGSNLLIVDERAEGTLAVAISSLRQQDVTVDVVDFVGEDEYWARVRDQIEGSSGVSVHGRRGMASALSDLAAIVHERHSRSDHKAPPHVLVVAAMARARDFDPNDSFNEESPSHILGQILRDGPEVGVFVVAWFDRPAGINKRLDNQQINEFGQRLVTQMSRDDSSMLIDSDSAGGLKPGQAILADVDRAVELKIRTLSAPPVEWLARLGVGMGAR